MTFWVAAYAVTLLLLAPLFHLCIRRARGVSMAWGVSFTAFIVAGLAIGAAFLIDGVRLAADPELAAGGMHLVILTVIVLLGALSGWEWAPIGPDPAELAQT